MGVGSTTLHAPTWGSTADYLPRRARGYQQGLFLSGRLPRHCIDRCRYHQGLTMQFLAMTRFRDIREDKEKRDKKDKRDKREN